MENFKITFDLIHAFGACWKRSDWDEEFDTEGMEVTSENAFKFSGTVDWSWLSVLLPDEGQKLYDDLSAKSYDRYNRRMDAYDGMRRAISEPPSGFYDLSRDKRRQWRNQHINIFDVDGVYREYGHVRDAELAVAWLRAFRTHGLSERVKTYLKTGEVPKIKYTVPDDYLLDYLD